MKTTDDLQRLAKLAKIRDWATIPDSHYGFRYRFNHETVTFLLTEIDRLTKQVTDLEGWKADIEAIANARVGIDAKS